MAELATIARPYAEALFNASQGDLNGTAQWLDARSPPWRATRSCCSTPAIPR